MALGGLRGFKFRWLPDASVWLGQPPISLADIYGLYL